MKIGWLRKKELKSYFDLGYAVEGHRSSSGALWYYIIDPLGVSWGEEDDTRPRAIGGSGLIKKLSDEDGTMFQCWDYRFPNHLVIRFELVEEAYKRTQRASEFSFSSVKELEEWL